MRHVVGIVHGKGGVGKSTLAVNVAYALHQELDVVIADADAQGTATSWRASGDGTLPEVHRIEKPSQLQRRLKQLTFDVCIVDGGGYLDKMHAAIIKASDTVLIPVQPSPADIWPTETIVDLIRRRQKATGGPQAAFVVSRRKAGTRLSKGVQAILERFELPVWEGTCDRVAYAEAMGRGTSVIEMSDDKAAAEIDKITNNLRAML